MSYQYWPSGLPPYTAYTYVTDRVTLVNHYSIMNGLARDVGWIEHNINTTHLFASGYATPVTSGFFKNIDTNYLYCHNLYSKSVIFNKMVEPHILKLYITGDRIDMIDSAIVNCNISVSGDFKSIDNKFILNNSGLIYNPDYISGSLYHHYISKDKYEFQNGSFNSLTINSGNLTVNANHKIFIENVGSFNPTGSLQESSLIWNPVLGHDHSINKINSKNITDTPISFNNDLEITSNQGFFDISNRTEGYPVITNSGLLDCSSYESITYYEDVEFYELDYTNDAIYICDNGPSGSVKDLDIGICSLVSNNGYIYASSDTLPSGVSDLTYNYIYKTKDMNTWEGLLVSGVWHPNVSGVGKISALCNHNTMTTAILNTYVNSGNFSMIINEHNNSIYSGVMFPIGAYAHGSSRYITGLSSFDKRLFVYGYEYPHIYNSGIPKWDRNCILYNEAYSTHSLETTSTGQDLSYSGVPYKYSYPFICTYNSYPLNNYFWLDGTYNGREPYLTSSDNGDVFDMLEAPSNDFSGYFAGLFGNGFSEVTSLLSISTQYRNDQRGLFTLKNNGKIGRTDLIENDMSSPLLIFGNSSISVNTAADDTIFGGCIPLVLNIDKRIYPSGIHESKQNDELVTSGNVSYYPTYLHGSNSLIDDTVLFRIPAYHYYGINKSYPWHIANNNLFNEWPDNSGRLWTDYSDTTYQRTELINLCPWNPGLLIFPFGGSGQVYYKHDNSDVTTKLNYTSMLSDTNGLIIPSGTFSDHRNYPTYTELTNEIKQGFWSSKTFDWYYIPETDHTSDTEYFAASGNAPEPPSGSYHKTNYYTRPKCPVQYNGVVYAISEFGTGFYYISLNGSECVDDGVQYSDLIKYGNLLYGVGIEEITKNLTVRIIKRNSSYPVKLHSSMYGSKLTPKFLLHKSLLYIGIGEGHFLVKIPSHTDLCLTSNL